MRVTYRYSSNKDYWDKRWAQIPADRPMQNLDIYPLKYAEKVLQGDKSARILEAGCGAGRILRYYHERGYNIAGIDFVEVAIDKLKTADESLSVTVGNIADLDYPDDYFQFILAFGLFHNLENNLQRAVSETYRVLNSGGKVCASFRADNLQTKITDWMTEFSSNRNGGSSRKHFHKLNLTRNEFVELFECAGFTVRSIENVVNMPFLYKFKFFRAKDHKSFNENIARGTGYRLSWYGELIQNFLMRLMPNQFCNIYVLIAEK